MKSILLFLALLTSAQSIAQQPIFEWAGNVGSYISDNPTSTVVDREGNVYFTGKFYWYGDLDPGPGDYGVYCGDYYDAFIIKLDSLGSLVWAKATNGGCWGCIVEGRDLAVDAQGNVFVVGSFVGSTDFDPGPGNFELQSAGYGDIFILKLNEDGDFVWAKRLGGNQADTPYAMEMDQMGNMYLTGGFGGTADFDPGLGIANLTTNGYTDAFVTKLDSAGNLLWAKGFGGNQIDRGFGLAVGPNGNICITGQFDNTVDFDPGADTFNLIAAGQSDAFIVQLDNHGNFKWAHALGGNQGDFLQCVTIDSLNNVFATGGFYQSIQFPPGSGVPDLVSNGLEDILIIKLDSSGNFNWGISEGGTLDDWGRSIDSDNSGAIYVTGKFALLTDFDPGQDSFTMVSTSFTDVFFQKLDTDGNLIWAKSIEGGGADEGRCVFVDEIGNIYSTGEFSGTIDCNPGLDVAAFTSKGGYDPYILKWSQEPNSINQPLPNASAQIYPNPNTGRFSVSLDRTYPNVQIEVSNTLGQGVLKINFEHIQSFDIQLDAPVGIYFVSIEIGDGKPFLLKMLKE